MLIFSLKKHRHFGDFWDPKKTTKTRKVKRPVLKGYLGSLLEQFFFVQKKTSQCSHHTISLKIWEQACLKKSIMETKIHHGIFCLSHSSRLWYVWFGPQMAANPSVIYLWSSNRENIHVYHVPIIRFRWKFGSRLVSDIENDREKSTMKFFV